MCKVVNENNLKRLLDIKKQNAQEKIIIKCDCDTIILDLSIKCKE